MFWRELILIDGFDEFDGLRHCYSSYKSDTLVLLSLEIAKQATVETIVNRYALTRFYFRLTIIEESVKRNAVE